MISMMQIQRQRSLRRSCYSHLVNMNNRIRVRLSRTLIFKTWGRQRPMTEYSDVGLYATKDYRAVCQAQHEQMRRKQLPFPSLEIIFYRKKTTIDHFTHHSSTRTSDNTGVYQCKLLLKKASVASSNCM